MALHGVCIWLHSGIHYFQEYTGLVFGWTGVAFGCAGVLVQHIAGHAANDWAGLLATGTPGAEVTCPVEG